MSAKEMAVWNYNDNVNNANNYSGTIVPCDLDRLSSGASPNGTYANNNLCPGEGSKCCNSGTAYAYEKVQELLLMLAHSMNQLKTLLRKKECKRRSNRQWNIFQRTSNDHIQ